MMLGKVFLSFESVVEILVKAVEQYFAVLYNLSCSLSKKCPAGRGLFSLVFAELTGARKKDLCPGSKLVSHAAVICLVTQRSSPTAAETWTTFLARFKPITVAVPFSELARASKFSTRDSSNHSLRFIVDLLDSHTRDKHEITSKEIHGSYVFIDNNHLALSDILQLI